MRMKTRPKRDADDLMMDLMYKMQQGTIDDLTWLQTADSIIEDEDNAISVHSFLHGLHQDKRRSITVVGHYLRRIGRIQRKINMIENNFETNKKVNNNDQNSGRQARTKGKSKKSIHKVQKSDHKPAKEQRQPVHKKSVRRSRSGSRSDRKR